VIKKYGKPLGSIADIKSNYVSNNDEFLEKSKRIADAYRRQPPRHACKNCAGPIGDISFTKSEVAYGVCRQCGHLNGLHKDTLEFCRNLYEDHGSASHYGDIYQDAKRKDYATRVDEIYLPKARFLLSVLESEGIDYENLKYLDFGCGAGHFLAALRKAGLERIRGLELSRSLAGHGNAMLNEEIIQTTTVQDATERLRTTDANVLSLIGVLEHLHNPRQVLRATQSNKNLRYLYLSLPTFGLSVCFENVFNGVMDRQLTGGHTHLYTESSIDWLCREFGFEKLGQWWFGLDMFDLYRNLMVVLQKQGNTELAEHWESCFLPLVDELQAVVDKKKLSSEVHLLLKINAN
jgi:SAM-dependent methyltransferase